MKKILSVLAIVAATSISNVQADVIGFEVGGYQWKPDYKGEVSSGATATNIDLQDDLGFEDDSHNIIYALVEHPVPFLPNIKITSADLESSANKVLTRSINYGGTTYSVNDSVASTIDTSHTEYTLYYEILDNWINIDAGVSFRQYDGEVRLESANATLNEVEVLDVTIPLVYAKARADLPFTGFFVDAQMNIISYDDESVSDMMIGIGYESDIGFGASIGYKAFDLEADEDDLKVDVQFEGAYISAFFHF